MSDRRAPRAVTYALGVDVSTYQQDINWIKVAEAGARFAFMRIGDGLIKDSRFERNWVKAASVGMLRGVYHVLRPDRDGQAAWLRDTLGGKEPELGVWSDLEIQGLDAGRCGRFLDAADEQLGRTVHVYSRASFLNEMGPLLWAQKRRLWVASPGTIMPVLPAAWPSWEFWQWGQTTIDGRTVDVNYYHGTASELIERYSPTAPDDHWGQLFQRLDRIIQKLEA